MAEMIGFDRALAFMAAVPIGIISLLGGKKTFRAWWRMVRHRCSYCGARRSKREGDDAWIGHIVECRRAKK